MCSLLLPQLAPDAAHGVVGQFFTTIEAHGQEITKILPTADGVQRFVFAQQQFFLNTRKVLCQ